ncbi:MAG: winged helix-turn-helix transcriptional regulator, partial [Methanobacterium sp.]|nr:winged helix-turn-helix transcriptional regulator [Methanobacterium sp.]
SNMEACEMQPTCKEVFTDFLNGNTELLKKNNVTETSIKEKKDELTKIKDKAPYSKCETCFTEVQTLFNQQLNLIRSNDIYNSESAQEEKPKISSIQEKKLVKEVLDPISNKQRLQILKEMSSKAQSFSALSELTGLRGGNLLFHIQKLQDHDLIIQRHERGDYMITNKGFNLLMLLAEFQKQL